MGRPAYEITEDVLKKVEILAGQGLTKKQIARVLGISYQTLNEKQKEYPEFSDAIKEGQAKGVATISNALFKAAKGGNITAMIFYLKNRACEEWKDRVPEGSGQTEQKVSTINLVTVDGRKDSSTD